MQIDSEVIALEIIKVMQWNVLNGYTGLHIQKVYTRLGTSSMQTLLGVSAK